MLVSSLDAPSRPVLLGRAVAAPVPRARHGAAEDIVSSRARCTATACLGHMHGASPAALGWAPRNRAQQRVLGARWLCTHFSDEVRPDPSQSTAISGTRRRIELASVPAYPIANASRRGERARKGPKPWEASGGVQSTPRPRRFADRSWRWERRAHVRSPASHSMGTSCAQRVLTCLVQTPTTVRVFGIGANEEGSERGAFLRETRVLTVVAVLDDLRGERDSCTGCQFWGARRTRQCAQPASAERGGSRACAGHNEALRCTFRTASSKALAPMEVPGLG